MGMDEKKGKDKKVLLICIAVVGVVVLAIVGHFAVNGFLPQESMSRAERDANASMGQIEGKSKEEIQKELNRIVEEGMFNISINPVITFANGNAEGDFRIENVPSNRYLMKVVVSLKDTHEIVYTSGLLEPNYHIQTAKLDVPLDKGTYDAVAKFTAYYPDTEEATGSAAVNVKLAVKS